MGAPADGNCNQPYRGRQDIPVNPYLLNGAAKASRSAQTAITPALPARALPRGLLRSWALGLALTLAPGLASAQATPSQVTVDISKAAVIDMHFHAEPADGVGPPPVLICTPFDEFPYFDPGRGKRFIDRFNETACRHKLLSSRSSEEIKAGALAALRKDNIVAVASGPAELVEDWRRAAPDHIISAIGFDLSDAPSIETLRTLHAEGRLAVIGEIGSQYDGAAPNDPRLEPYYALAEELDVPIALHVGLGPPGAAYQGMSHYRMRDSNPLLLEDVLVRHPKLRLYVMHAGWPMLNEMIGLLYAHPQVYVDVGVIDYVIPKKEFYRYLRTLVEAGFEKRIMYGTDNMVWPETIDVALHNIRHAPFLSASQKRDILHDNAARFLRLDTASASAGH